MAARVPVYYVNLASRPDRRTFMEEQFDRLGIAAERIEAVRADEVPSSLRDFHLGPRGLWRLGTGDLACGLSHQRAWTRFLESGRSAAIVLEDDAILARPLADFLDDGLLERLGADLVKLETFCTDVKLGSTVQRVGAIELRELCSSQMGGAAYLIGRNAAAMSLRHPMRDTMAVDRFLFGRGGPHLLRSRVLQASPSPAMQLDKQDNAHPVADSDITATYLPARKHLPDLRDVLPLHLDHAGRLIRLAMRDLRGLRSPRVVVPFAGETSS